MAQVELFSVSPLGKAPPAVIEQVIVAPLLATVGVTEKAVPTVPMTELGEILMVGRAAFTVIVTLAEAFPAEFVALMV